MGCAVNPECCAEIDYNYTVAEIPKKVVIIGGGIAGMEAALDLRKKGHTVDLYEASDKLGGAFIAASSMSFKVEDKKLISWYVRECEEAGVTFHMNTPVTKELLETLEFDEIIVATGATPRTLSNIPGIEKVEIINATDALLGKKAVGENVVVIGGGLTGIEMTYDMVLSGKKVEVLEMKDSILGMDVVCAANGIMLKQIIKYYQIPVHTSASIVSFEEGKVIYSVNGEEKCIECDSIIASVGYLPNTDLYDSIKEKYGEKVHLIGDCKQVANLLNATWSAAELAYTI